MAETDFQETVTLPQELNDALLALKALVVGIKAKKPIVQLALEELPALVKLAGELQPIPSEVVTSKGLQCIGLRGADIASALLGLQ